MSSEVVVYGHCLVALTPTNNEALKWFTPLPVVLQNHPCVESVAFSSVQSFDRLGRRVHGGRFSRDPLPVFSAGSSCEQFWHEHGCSLSDGVHPAHDYWPQEEDGLFDSHKASIPAN